MDQNLRPDVEASHEEELTRMVREGVRPEDVKGRMGLMRDKLVGDAPLGVDAPTVGMRKAIGGAGSLFVVIKNGFFGALLVLLGGLFCWAGSSGHFDAKSFGIGVGGLLLGMFSLSRAIKAWKALQAIRRA
jgi:hypothetical protein